MTFEKFALVCQVIGVIGLLVAGGIYIFGLPTFDNYNVERQFCWNEGGKPFEPSRYTHNKMLCGFSYNNTMSMYAMIKQTEKEKEYRKVFNKSVVDYCFICWSGVDCELDTLIKIDGRRRNTRC